MRAESHHPADTRLRVFLFCLLLGVYLLVYIPRPSSADGDAVLAVAASTLREGSPNINSMAYLDWLLPLPASRMGAFGEDGALYAKKGVTPSLFLLPLVALADALPHLTTQATAMLLNPLVTAATAVVLFNLARRLGYRPGVAFITALLYGLATFALVYTKTLFGEPLAALLLLLAVLFAHRFRETHAARDAALAGAALGLMTGVNTIYALLIPLIGLYLLGGKNLRQNFMENRATMLRAAISFALPVAVFVALLGLYNWARFGSPLSSGYHFAEGEGFTRPLLTGLYGLFISPYRGMFWYNPLLLLALPGWLMLRRSASEIAWLALALTAALALAFASWWSWHGGIVWGPRFLLPAAPFFALCLAPLVDAAYRRGRNAVPLQATLAAFALLSFGVQLLGALYSYYPYINGYLNALYWTGEMDSAVTALEDVVLYTPHLSPIVGHMALAWAGWSLEPAWAANGVNVAHLAAALAIIAAGALALLRGLHRRAALVAAGVVAFVSLNVVAAVQPDEIRAVAEQLQPRGTVVAATTLYESNLVDLEGQRVITMNAPTSPDDEWARRLWSYAKARGGRLWLLTWFGAADAANWQERDLWQNAAFVTERTVPGHRAVLFDLTPCNCEMQRGGWTFGDSVRLDTYALQRESDGVRLVLAWSTDAPPDAPIQWFVHLLDAGGNIVAQQDRAPQGGYAPVTDWTAGKPVIDRLFFPLPPDTDTAGWQVRVGWVKPDGESLAVEDAEGDILPEPFVLIGLESAD